MIRIDLQVQGGDVAGDQIQGSFWVDRDIDAQLNGDPQEVLIDIVFGTIAGELQHRHFIDVVLDVERPNCVVLRNFEGGDVVHVEKKSWSRFLGEEVWVRCRYLPPWKLICMEMPDGG